MDKKVFLCLIFLAAIPFNCLAQRPTEALAIRGAYLSTAQVADLFSTGVYPKNAFANLSVGVLDAGIRGNYRFKLSENANLKVGLDYGILNFRYQDSQSTLRVDTFLTNLHAFNLPIEYQQKIKGGWQLNLQAQPGIASNWSGGLHSKDFLFQGFGYLSKVFKEDESLVLGLGLSYNTLLGKAGFLPIINFYWQTDKVKIDALLPYYGGIYYLAGSKLELGLLGRMQGNRYNLNFDNRPSFPAGYTGYNWMSGGLDINLKITKQLVLSVEGGINANRTYEIYLPNERKIADYDPQKFEFWYSQFGIQWFWD
ncbi:MAG: DUF6268 family outer membrane beta-barrel protein [Microscillaceae bacterium]|jgi:hypothetical protein|nr:DUF6268 family outer membrane beta-barrel protein [Microscillaceae bacterium]